jgi:hypothetical protein
MRGKYQIAHVERSVKRVVLRLHPHNAQSQILSLAAMRIGHGSAGFDSASDLFLTKES